MTHKKRGKINFLFFFILFACLYVLIMAEFVWLKLEKEYGMICPRNVLQESEGGEYYVKNCL